jgi:hypothetical protein
LLSLGVQDVPTSEIDASVRALLDLNRNSIRRDCVDLLEDQVALLNDLPGRDRNNLPWPRIVLEDRRSNEAGKAKQCKWTSVVTPVEGDPG